MQGGILVHYEFELFHGVVLKYLTYDPRIYALVKDVKKWKDYPLSKHTMIHTHRQPVRSLQRMTKLQHAIH
jgi:hypothetical protein